ncbi:hypothetical protein PBY51_024104 [Eleginops maclovinus]|uniref:Uncharacterized protein n=1 Tax=Eleginops maclovinus TaxID=56733 RepID=A0AAN8ANN9_ELEMC|nr:hypothetical protein PBY51_024104 [Eleginops maclovinus]
MLHCHEKILKSTGFHSLDEDTNPKHPNVSPHEIPRLPSPLPDVLDTGNTPEKKKLELKHLGFPSLDNEVACLVPQPLSERAFTHQKKQPVLMNFKCSVPDLDSLQRRHVPLPPPTDAWSHKDNIGHFQEKRYPDLSIIRFPSLEDDPKCPHLLPPPSPKATELNQGISGDKTKPEVCVTGFPSLNDEVACLVHQPLSERAFTHQKKQPDVMNFKFSLPDVDSLQQRQVPLPPPTDAWSHRENTVVKENQRVKRIMSPSVDDDIQQRHVGFISQNKQPDVKRFKCSVPDVDSLQQHHVPLPPLTDAWSNKENTGHLQEKKYPDLSIIRFPSLQDDPKCPHLLPPPRPRATELDQRISGGKTKAEMSVIRFPSLVDEVACLVPQPLSERAFIHQKKQPDVTNFKFSLPAVDSLQQRHVPLPLPTDAWSYKGNTGVKENQSVQRIMFPSVDDDIEQRHMGFTHQKKLPVLMSFKFSVSELDSFQQCHVPLPPPTDAWSHKDNIGHFQEKRYPDLSIIRFPSLDDEVSCLVPQPLSERAFTHQKKQPDVKNFKFSLPDVDSLQQRQVPLPPPTEAWSHREKTVVKENQRVKRIMSPSVDDDIQKRYMGFISQNKQPDVKRFKFDCPEVDSLLQRQVPLPPPTGAWSYKGNTGVKENQTLQRIMFPSVDDDIQQLHMGFTHQKKLPVLMSFKFSVPDVDPVTLCPPPVGMPHNAKEKYHDLSAVAFPCLD